jgi:hypothetical protein
MRICSHYVEIGDLEELANHIQRSSRQMRAIAALVKVVTKPDPTLRVTSEREKPSPLDAFIFKFVGFTLGSLVRLLRGRDLESGR